MKTLQDFEYEECGYGVSHVRRDDLRKEAIIWVKHWLKVLGNPIFLIDEKYRVGFKRKDMDLMNNTNLQASASIGAFVDFFNLTEDDFGIEQNTTPKEDSQL